MKVFKYAGRVEASPYLDNCYISATPLNIGDEEVLDPFAFKEFFRVGQIDYIQFRDSLKTEILPIWNQLSVSEQREMVRHNIAPSKEIKDSLASLEEQMSEYMSVIDREVAARKNRWNDAMYSAGFYLQGNDLARLMMYNDAKVFRDDYVEADLPHLILWLTDGAYPALGIDFTTTGFGSKPYYSIDIKNSALSILLK